MKHLRQAGFTVIEGVVILLIVSALVGVGIWVTSNADDDTKDTDTSQADESTPEAPTIESDEDLDAAEEALDDTNVDAGDADNSELESQSNF